MEASKRLVNSNRLFFTLVKKEEGYWPHLMKVKTKVSSRDLAFSRCTPSPLFRHSAECAACGSVSANCCELLGRICGF